MQKLFILILSNTAVSNTVIQGLNLNLKSASQFYEVVNITALQLVCKLMFYRSIWEVFGGIHWCFCCDM